VSNEAQVDKLDSEVLSIRQLDGEAFLPSDGSGGGRLCLGPPREAPNRQVLRRARNPHLRNPRSEVSRRPLAHHHHGLTTVRCPSWRWRAGRWDSKCASIVIPNRHSEQISGRDKRPGR